MMPLHSAFPASKRRRAFAHVVPCVRLTVEIIDPPPSHGGISCSNASNIQNADAGRLRKVYGRRKRKIAQSSARRQQHGASRPGAIHRAICPCWRASANGVRQWVFPSLKSTLETWVLYFSSRVRSSSNSAAKVSSRSVPSGCNGDHAQFSALRH